MSAAFKNYLLRLHIFSVVLAVALWFANQHISESFQFPFFWTILIVFHLVSIFIFSLLHKANQESAKKFIRSFMAVSFIKLFSAMLVLAIGGLMYKRQAFGFILNVMMMYLAYLVFDVVLLMRTINKKG